MSDIKDLKKKSFADIFKNILKETKKEKDLKKEEKPIEITTSESKEKLDNVHLKEPLSSTKNEKIIFYEERKNSINDETIFDFVIKGGPHHTDLLVACASYRNAKGGGEPVALNCKWFNITDNNELREIDGVTGAFYQPCADDIGTKICVQAVPILGLKEYTGMPIFAEVGPLLIDSEIEREVYENFEKNFLSISLKIEMISPGILGDEKKISQYPCEGNFEIKDNLLTIMVEDQENRKEIIKSEIGPHDFPQIFLLKKSNNIFEIFFSENEKIRCNTRTNKERDIIALSMRLLAGKQINDKEINESNTHINNNEEIIQEDKNEEELKENNENENESESHIKISEQSPQNNINENNDFKKDYEIAINKLKKEKMELFLKLDQLTKDILRLTKDKESNKIEIRNLTDSVNSLKKEKTETQEKLNNCTKNYYELLEENKHLKKTLELYMNEKIFLFQELDIYKKQIEEIEKIKQENMIIKPLQEEDSRKRAPSTSSNSLKSLNKEELLHKLNDLNAGIVRLETELKEKQSELLLKTQNNKELLFEKEELLNEVNYLRKKNKSLINEKILNCPPIQQLQGNEEKNEENNNNNNEQNYENEDEQKTNLESEIILKKAMDVKNIENLEEEIKKLREKVKNQEITIETLKIGLSQEISKKNEKPKSRFFGKNSSTNNLKEPLNKKTLNDFIFLQKLVNILTETIADKDLAIENQKQINKELMKRVEEKKVSNEQEQQRN